MILFVHLAQILAIDVRVNLGRGNIDVPEHFLDRAQVGAALQQMCGEGMAEGMRRHVLRDAGALDVSAENLPSAHSGERQPARVEEQNALA